MPIEDATRWNMRYGAATVTDMPKPRSLLVEHQPVLPPTGLALDIAMGRGGNAGWLLAQKLRVVGVDISVVAVRAAKQYWPALMGVVADLTTLPLPFNMFDVILNFYYLDRDLWPVYARTLRPGGVLLFETFTRTRLDVRPGTDPRYLLAPNELRAAFGAWDILTYREGGVDAAGQPCTTASLVARRRP